MKWIYCLFVFVSVNCELVNITAVPANITSPNPCTDLNHIFLTPGVLTAGANNRACVSRFYPEGNARLIISVYTEDKQVATASRELAEGDGGCLDIAIPQLPNTKADLIVNLRYPEALCTWERRINLRIASGRVVAVHTERARYRPGDLLRARIIVLKADLTPAHGAIEEIWLEGPRGAWDGARAAQWLRTRTRLGVAQVQHQLDELAPPGRWSIRVKTGDGSQGAAAFWVGNYELPPFQLSVRHAPRVLRTSERLVWTVCVRYPWTEAVEGMLVIRIRGAAASNGGIHTAVRLRAPRACHRHAAAARRVGLGGANSPDVVIADFSFQEEGTRIWQNTTVVSQVIDKRLSLEFLTKHRAVISSGLPYKLKIKATRWDDKPASNERIRVCRSPTSHASELTEVTGANLKNGNCDNAITDVTGIARVMFTVEDDGSAFYKFQATLQNDSTIAARPLYLPVQRSGSVHAALGPLRADFHAARTFVPLYLNVRNITNAITVHFVVITRGGIIYRWGATTQCPVSNSANPIQTATRNSRCNSVDVDANFNSIDANVNTLDANIAGLDAKNKLDINASDALLERYMLRVMLPIKVTHQMCPDSDLVAYFYYNGELVSASKHFEMEECFVNKVEATWQSRQTPPGSTTTLRLTTPGPALCALTALDTAAKWVQPAETVKDVVMTGLRKLVDGHRNLTEYDAAGECFFMTDTPDPPTTSNEITASWLASAGIRVIGGDMTRTVKCGNTPPAPLLADEITVPRSDFSEAWLWRLVTVSTNGTAVTTARAPDSITRYEASAVCISRTGLAVSPPAVLQVFREFFIHADSSRRLRRGDTTIVRYRLFNYLYEPLSVQIQILTDPHLEGPSDYVESACVAARSSVARRVEIRARLPGDARLSIRAKSVKDSGCPNVTVGRSSVSDEIIIRMTVEPEGVPVRDHKSILLCGKGSAESSVSNVNWSWPPVLAVPGTQSLTVWAVGDIAGPLLADADDLVLLPRGCGEQNMARLATNLLALQHLDNQSSAAVTARQHVARGFTRQLQYLHPLGGFSAFGAADAAPSTWLTAFAVRYLRKAHEVLTPGYPAPPALERAERWLLDQQMENGCFRNEGQVFHRELRGGLNEEGEIASVALTAYVITSLLEASILPSRVLRNTLSCLRAIPLKTKSPTRVYAHSLLAYAFMKLRRYEEEVKGVNEASLREGGVVLQQDEELRELVELLKMARRSGDYVWWETGSLSTSIEATGYALLALSGCPAELRDTSCAHDARAAIRWLSTHRNAAGGFVATQDTLVALEALISWSSVQLSPPTNLTVTSRSGAIVKTVNLLQGERVPDVMKMGVEMGGQLVISVAGTGCALVQATRFYNSISPVEVQNKQLGIQVAVHTDGAFDCDGNGTSCFCAAVVEACVVWSGEFPEMALLEVSLPGGFGADSSLLYSQLQHRNTLLRRIELSPNSGRATMYLGTRDGSDILDRGGHQCYQIHAVGPKARTKPAYAKIMDYYRPVVNDTQMYTIPEECPPRISHQSDQYLVSDNLFNKARSLSDSNEIVITNDFSFEDIPEGIPLEDPMYENLTKENKNTVQETVKVAEKFTANTGKVKNETADLNTSIHGVNGVSEESNTTATLRNKIKEFTTVESTLSNTSERLNTNDKTEPANKYRRKQKLVTISDKLSNIDASHEFREVITRQGKANLQAFHYENEIPRTLESENVILRTDPIQQQTTHRNEDNEKNEETGETFQQKAVENPNLSGFHIIDSEKDLEVPSGLEGPVPAMLLPPPSFQSRSYISVLPPGLPHGVHWRMQPMIQNPRSWNRAPDQLYYQPRSFFYQPIIRDEY